MASGVHELLIRNLLSQRSDVPVSSVHFSPIGGGSINETYKITLPPSQRFFCKINAAQKFPSLFAKEVNGLRLLAKQNIIRTPYIIGCEESEGNQVLILEWVEQGLKTKMFWEIFGLQLAKLHQVSNHFFGLYEDNYMGALRQSNTPAKNWVDLFIHQRLEPQLRLASENRLLELHQVHQFQHLYKFLSEIFPEEDPSLLHGDLWSGNFLCDENGLPVLIDPAVYFGNRHMDLAMTTLFGGFDHAFYDSYHDQFPLPKNHRQIWDICNLYPLLIHLNLFGKSYLHDILQTVLLYQ
jgi:protein-ribulosamine 3-kinase